MPFNARSQNYEIVLPIKGVDRGTVRAKPIPGTCPDCRNVRSWDLRDRRGLGKRSGSIAAFVDRAGAAGARRVTGLIRRARIATVVSTSIPFVETPVDTTSGGNTFSGSSTSATYGDHGDNFVRYVVDQGTTPIMNATLDDRVAGAGPAFTAEFYRALSGTGTSRHPHLVSSFYTTNDVTATFSFHTQARTNEDGGAADACTRIGPAIRGTDRGNDFVMAMLRRNTTVIGDDKVRLEIVHVVDGAIVATGLAVGADKTLLGGAGILGNPCVIRIWEVDNLIQASISWVGALSGPANYTETISVTTTQNVGSKRGGVIGAWFTESASVRWRSCTRIQFTKLVPPGDEVLTQLLGTQTNPTTTDQYFLPSGWVSSLLTITSGAVSTTTGFASSSGDPTYIAIDDNNNRIHHVAAAAAADKAIWLRATTTAFDENSRYGVDFIPTKAIPASPVNEGVGMVWKLDDTDTSFAAIGVECKASTPRSESGIAWFAQGSFNYQTAAGSLTSRSLNLGGTASGAIARCGVRCRWSHTDSTVSLTQNGIPLYTYTFTAGEQTALANLAGHKYAALFAIADAAGTSYCSDIADIRFTIVESNPTGIGDTYSQIAVFTPQLVQLGDLRSGTLQEVTGTYLTNASPSGFFLGTKYYAVDGVRSIVIDPATLAASDWTASAGTVPPGCHLATIYRGRAVLARQDATPNIWYMSRVLNPLDWDYGASPVATSAVAGSDANIGQPPEPITALMSFSDDYMFFGCTSSIWMLEGDPGYQGAIQNLSHQTGVLGQRTWCVSETGDLYFMGNGGLYRIARGTRDIENISGDRLAERLDRVNLATTLVQMVYDSFKACVHIFLTLTDLTRQSIHVIYDTRRDAFWFDTLPRNSDPWSVCDIVGQEDEDRRILWGGNDGWCRRWSDTNKGDHDSVFPIDGSSDTATEVVAAIDAFIRFAPVESQDAMLQLLLTAIQFQGASENGAVSWEILTADSCEDVGDKVRGTGDRSGSVFGDGIGHQQIIRVRLRAGVQQLVMTQSSATLSYALERIVAMYTGTSNRR